jgi:hypothetical protein
MSGNQIALPFFWNDPYYTLGDKAQHHVKPAGGIVPEVLIIFRVFAMCYTCGPFFYQVITYGVGGTFWDNYVLYFTNWQVAHTAIYFILGVAGHLDDSCRKKKPSTDNTTQNEMSCISQVV